MRWAQQAQDTHTGPHRGPRHSARHQHSCGQSTTGTPKTATRVRGAANSTAKDVKGFSRSTGGDCQEPVVGRIHTHRQSAGQRSPRRARSNISPSFWQELDQAATGRLDFPGYSASISTKCHGFSDIMSRRIPEYVTENTNSVCTHSRQPGRPHQWGFARR